MPAGMWFWLVYAMAVFCFVFLSWPFPENSRRVSGAIFLLFVLVGLLAWAAISPPIH